MSVPSFDAADSAPVDGVDDSVEITSDTDTGEGGESSNGHPAWKEVYDVLPSSLHPIVEPALRKWDQGVQERFQQVQSRYDPYKDIIENAQPDDIQQAMQIAKMLEADPKAFYERLGQAVGGQQNQGQPGTPPESDTDADDDVYDLNGQQNLPPEVQRQLQELQQQQEQVTNYVRAQAEKEANEAAEAKLEQELNSLREQHGEFDEEFVLSYAINNGGDLNKGMQKYLQLVGKLQGVPAPGASLPKVQAPGGATPSNTINPAELNPRDTKSLVVNLLKQAHDQN